ncbi:unnamed protein product [Orchesella dallaii]|uniref:Odorant receptor n=1 Tax=Orchesella dallaii TaxID=48710 RepID=A0ABP1R6N5_9HEXA
MALGKGATNVQFFIQKYSIFPPFAGHLIVKDCDNKVKMSCIPYQQSKSAKIVWQVVSNSFLLLFLLTLWRLQVLISQWKGNKDMEQLGTLCILLTISIMSHILYHYFNVYNAEFCYVVTQACKLLNLRRDTEGVEEIKSMSNFFHVVACMDKLEILVYLFASVFVLVPVAVPCLPLITRFEPFQVVLFETAKFLLPVETKAIRISSKFFAILIYSFLGMHAGAVILFLLGMFITVGGCVLHFSTQLKRTANATTKTDFLLNTKALRNLRKSIGIYRVLQIETSVSRQISKDMFGVMGTVGMVFVASSAYFVIFSYGVIPSVMYLGCATSVFFSFAIAFILITLASLPDKHTNLFKNRWKWVVLPKKWKVSLNSCGPVGFSLGNFVRIATARTAIIVADTLLNCIATMILMGEFKRKRIYMEILLTAPSTMFLGTTRVGEEIEAGTNLIRGLDANENHGDMYRNSIK